MQTLSNKIIQFELPANLACPKPTEERNLKRDAVRLLVSTDAGEIHHDRFSNFEKHLQAGDVLVVNTSATVASAFKITLPNGKKGMLHLSSKLNRKEWLIEIREISGNKTRRWKEGKEGMLLLLPNKATFELKKRFYKDHQALNLWIGQFNTNERQRSYMQKFAQPIKYAELDNPYPLSYYQTLFSFHSGSAEMPSAGRGFTLELMRKLLKKGIILAPILLHTGISSLEDDEKPYSEYMEINPVSALLINEAKAQDRRVIAVGTTAIRAIESAVNEQGEVQAFWGNTNLFIQKSQQIQVTSGLLTGFHEPKASHLNILQSLAGFQHIEQAYKVAIKSNYQWHEFGDLHLILA